MDFKVLKRSHLKRNIIIGVVVVAIISAVVLTFTRAKYRVTESIPLVNGTINYTLPDLNIVGLYIDGVEAEELDSNKTYTLDTTQSTCTYKDGTEIENLSISYDSETSGLSISPYTTKGTRCTLYFEEYTEPVRDVLLANYPTVLTRNNFRTTITNTTTGTIYKSLDSTQYDDYGEVYYFAGNPTDNWVKFGEFYWRIIRINGDGTIRLIYQGTSPSTTGSETQIGTSIYNTRNVIFQNSTIMNTLDIWYQNNLTEVSNKIDTNVGFCNDRLIYSSNANVTYYGRYRLQIIYTPSYKCTSDEYLIKSGIGLITADEIAYAGGVYLTSNSNFYLYTGMMYWTMTPIATGSNGMGNLYANAEITYSLSAMDADVNRGVRPVINLKADVTISSGNGTTSNPYIIS